MDSDYNGPISIIYIGGQPYVILPSAGYTTWYIGPDGAGNLNVYQGLPTGGGNSRASFGAGLLGGFDSDGPITVSTSQLSTTHSKQLVQAGSDVASLLGTDGNGGLVIDNFQTFPYITANDPFHFFKTVAYYNNIATGGLGIPAIYNAGAQTLYTNAAPTTRTYTPPAAAGTYRLGGSLNILTGGTLTFKIKVSYTDAGGTARATELPVFVAAGGTTLLSGGPAANSTGRFTMLPFEFSIDNSASNIVVSDNAGTYTAGTYYWVPHLEQLV